uniref:DH domain-containing protein n=1 Tax=Glossina morsitans morsitans TaxID=37546 RepID=A0A1B0GBC8_GLOMM
MDSALQSNTGDDSDNDVVTDFLNTNDSSVYKAADTINLGDDHVNACATHQENDIVKIDFNSLIPQQEKQDMQAMTKENPVIQTTLFSVNNSSPNYSTSNCSTYPNNLLNNNNIFGSNMIPTINVTHHSSANALKYNSIFEDTLTQLQNIRESVVQMKNSTTPIYDSLSTYGLVHSAILSASLPDLNSFIHNGGSSKICNGSLGCHFLMAQQRQPQQCSVNADRRKSWTAINDLAPVVDGTNKSMSLSSLDSEEQEAIRVTEQRRRSARNSTGGISTHSLNEAELARDFERMAVKRNLATDIISRIPLQKSISTSSIIAKDEIKVIARHLTDSEDENQSLLRAHTKIEVYDNVDKRRKRGSLFFRKKKDKTKMKTIGGQIISCDMCGMSINLNTLKDHQFECKGKKIGSGYKKGEKSDSSPMFDYYDGPEQTANYSEDAPLIRSEFPNESRIEAHDLGADRVLAIDLEEHDSWSPGVPRDILKSMKEQQIKRQEHIYEFIMTEKHHCQTLLVMQKAFVESLERHFPSLNCNKMFPRLTELTELHTDFLKKLRLKQRERHVVDSIANILLDFFSLEKTRLRLAYGEFCANYRTALELYKSCETNQDFLAWYRHCLTNKLLKKKGIPECILFVTQRLTKYPLLIDPLLKSARDDEVETKKLQEALSLVKELLFDVNACVDEKELRDRQIDICNCIDNKSFAIYKNKPFRKSDVAVESRRRLKFEGSATLMQGRAKIQSVLVMVLTDCLCFLTENSAHNKYMFFTPEHKAGVVPLQKLLIREKAGTESRGIYIISSNPLYPVQMYELKVQKPKDKNVWIESIRRAVRDCPLSDIMEAEDYTVEEKLRIGVNKREIIEKMRQKDIEQALLLEEKIILLLNLIQNDQKLFSSHDMEQHQHNAIANMSAAQFLTAFGSYKDISVGVDCDTSEIWKRVLTTVQEISQLAGSVYTAATGQPVSRSVSSVGEKQSETYLSPTLPKRAETFAGFDEKRAKNTFTCRDINKYTLQIMTPRLQELEEKKGLKNTSVTALSPSSHATDLFTLSDDHNLEHAASSGSSINDTKDHDFAFLQITHNLHTLLCIISQQMTAIQSLQLQSALYRENPRAPYTHNDQLEELRNLQDKLQEEKTLWMRQKEHQEQELAEKKQVLDKIQEQIKMEQEDIKQQREQLYRKMEVLSNQGLLLSPNTPLMLSSPLVQLTTGSIMDIDGPDFTHDGATMTSVDTAGSPTVASTNSNTVDRRKDKWRTASTISKAPPVNLLSAANAPKVQSNVVKQQIPIKLSSLSSVAVSSASSFSPNKVDKSMSFNSIATPLANSSHSSISSAGITQIFPLKLADKRPITPQIGSQHARTGSSPAIIQQVQTQMNINNTSPHIIGDPLHTYDQRCFLRGAFNTNTSNSASSKIIAPNVTGNTKVLHEDIVASASSTSSVSPSSSPATTISAIKHGQTKPEEKEIYF